MNSKIIFVIAFLAVLTGLYGMADTLLSTTDTASTSATEEKEIKYITVWRATSPLARGQALSPSSLTREQLTEEAALSLGINSDVTLKFEPTTLMNMDVKQGALVFPELQTSPGEAGYLNLITRGDMTLYPLTIASKNLIDNYIQPGDYIDIMAVSSPRTNLSNTTSTLENFEGVRASLLMQRIRVMSVGQSNTLAEKAGQRSTTTSTIRPKVNISNENESTVVIEVNPDDLAKLSLAQRTMYIEIYRSQHYRQTPDADVSDVIKNYTGIVELRGAGRDRLGEVF
ncbi:RcpC/CpaB family pilus assembly protein [Photobacterium profundum]|uniref:RcpC/CpaB family pilus assembly protein n=1 Tax=Photobacterium profundum TaxID=74109 RepID=UPI003D130BCF